MTLAVYTFAFIAVIAVIAFIMYIIFGNEGES